MVVAKPYMRGRPKLDGWGGGCGGGGGGGDETRAWGFLVALACGGRQKVVRERRRSSCSWNFLARQKGALSRLWVVA